MKRNLEIVKINEKEYEIEVRKIDEIESVCNESMIKITSLNDGLIKKFELLIKKICEKRGFIALNYKNIKNNAIKTKY